MADEENNEPKKRSGLVKILLFAFGGIALIGIGLGVGFVLFGSTQPDPSEEIEQIIERKMEEADAKKLAEEEAEKGDGGRSEADRAPHACASVSARPAPPYPGCCTPLFNGDQQRISELETILLS